MKDSRACQIYFTNLSELVVVIIIAGLIADTVCFDCFHNFHRNQFINGVVFGFLIVCALVVIEICITCDFSRCWSLIVACLGALCFFVVGILILDYVGGYPRYADRFIYLRLLIAGLLCFVLAGLFILNTVLLLKGDNLYLVNARKGGTVKRYSKRGENCGRKNSLTLGLISVDLKRFLNLGTKTCFTAVAPCVRVFYCQRTGTVKTNDSQLILLAHGLAFQLSGWKPSFCSSARKCFSKVLIKRYPLPSLKTVVSRLINYTKSKQT